jgi:nickel-dependent lactate racemase
MIQAHKALETASRACNDWGTIILMAECPDGLGRDDFLKWFEALDSRELAKGLCDKYQVNGQTAWNLLEKAERFDIRIVSGIDHESIGKMRLKKIDATEMISLSEATGQNGYIIPNGAKISIVM